MMDEDFNCSSACIGSSCLPSVATPGLTSPPYIATPVDHDYAKRKTLRRQQWQQQRHEERQADGTVPVLDTVSGVGLFVHFALGLEAHWGVLMANHHANGFGFSNNDSHMHWVIGMW